MYLNPKLVSSAQVRRLVERLITYLRKDLDNDKENNLNLNNRAKVPTAPAEKSQNILSTHVAVLETSPDQRSADCNNEDNDEGLLAELEKEGKLNKISSALK
jgi:hypothetical protein